MDMSSFGRLRMTFVSSSSSTTEQKYLQITLRQEDTLALALRDDAVALFGVNVRQLSIIDSWVMALMIDNGSLNDES